MSEAHQFKIPNSEFRFHSWYYCAQPFYHLILRHTLFNHDENGVVAGYRAEYFVNVSVVDVVGNGAGVAWSGTDNTHISREVDGAIARNT